jgi:uncharacterized damage-inducible protein DinB
MISDQFKKLLHYNLWANQKISSVISPLSEEQMNQNFKASFPNLTKAILHIYDAECIWLQRLQGISLEQWPHESLDENFQDYGWLLEQKSQDWIHYVEPRNDAWFEMNCSFNSLGGSSYQMRQVDVIQHVVNHSSYHRGQLVSMFRELELEEIPATDFIFYLRDQHS